MQKLLAWAKVGGNSTIGQPCRQKNVGGLRGRAGTGMRRIAAFFGPCVPGAPTAHGSIFSSYFKRLGRFAQLVTSSQIKSVRIRGILEDIKTQAAGLVLGGATGITQQGLHECLAMRGFDLHCHQ